VSEEGGVAQAQMYIDLNRPQEALRLLSVVLASNPDDVAALRTMALAHLRADSGRKGGDLAVRAATDAVNLSPSDAYAWRILALGYSRIGRLTEARQVARTARSLEPWFWGSHTLVAEIDCSGKYVTEETHAAVAEAMRLAPNEPSVLFAAARVAQVEGKLKDARRLYEQVLARRPNDENARNNLALISMDRGNTGKAVAGFAGILAQNPNSEIALRNLLIAGRRALRIVYFILIGSVVIAELFFTRTDEVTPAIGQIARLIVAFVAIASVSGYLLWIRRRAGIYFARFVRSIPSADGLLLFWAIALAVCLAALVLAAFASESDAASIYTLTELALIATTVIVSARYAARRRG
jgi:Flp pilus assembly protein TadD